VSEAGQLTANIGRYSSHNDSSVTEAKIRTGSRGAEGFAEEDPWNCGSVI
jgi:hypothetical protein